ncbi:MAG: hypothetical protein ACJA2Q_000199 [Pseudohongiellaceae bacterium]|jgi:hypothetical protein
MNIGDSKPEQEIKPAEDYMNTAIFPLAVSSLVKS